MTKDLPKQKSKVQLVYERLKQSSECIQFCTIVASVASILALLTVIELFGYLFNHNFDHRVTFWTNLGEGIVLCFMLAFYILAETGMYKHLFVIWNNLEVQFACRQETNIDKNYKDETEGITCLGWVLLITTYALSWLFLYGVWHHPSEDSMYFLAGIGVFLASRLILFFCTPPIIAIIYHINSILCPSTDPSSINNV
jgi:hypothetical protein